MAATLPLPAVLLVVLTACGAGADTVATAPSADAPATELQVEVVPTPGAEPQRWTLTCGPTGGDHPQAEKACEDLSGQALPMATPSGEICTEQYGGPEIAVVRGRFEGRPVSLRLSRTNGCRIAEWDRLGAALPAGG